MGTKVSAPSWSFGSDGARVSLLVPSVVDAKAICEGMDSTKKYTMEIKQEKRRRSLSSNSLLWAVLGDMAKALQKSAPGLTPEDIYRTYISHSGNYIMQEVMASELPKLRRIWCSNGEGWIVDVVDVVEDGDDQKISCRLFYGSSQYDQEEFSKLVDAVLQDAKAIGIDHTSESIRELMARYPGGQ